MNFIDILLNHGGLMLESTMELGIRCLLCIFAGHYFESGSVQRRSTNNLSDLSFINTLIS
jgi:hypothetical protein